MYIGSSSSKGEIWKRCRTCSDTPRVISASARQERKIHILTTLMALSRRIFPPRKRRSNSALYISTKGWGEGEGGWVGGGVRGE